MEATKIMYSVRKLLSLSVASLVLALSLAACDGGDDAGGVDGDQRVISALSAGELKEVCEAGRSSFEPNKDQEKALAKVLCTAQLALFGQCNPAAVEECVKEVVSAPAQGGKDSEEACELSVDAKACNVTVAQLYECSVDQLDALVDVAGKLTCENVLDGSTASERPASCKIVEQKCPSAFESDDDDAHE